MGGAGTLVREDVQRMLIKARYGRHYVIIDRGARAVYGSVRALFGANLLCDVRSAERL